MRKCNICGVDFDGMGNNPYPICAKEDYQSRCCDECNEKYVITARILKSHGIERPIKENDLVVVFYSKNSERPIDTMLETGKMLAGEATDNEGLPDNCWEGSWGSFLLDEKEDSFIIIEQ